VAVFLGVGNFPEELAWIGDDAATDWKVRHVRVGHASGEEVELQACHGVTRVGAAVDFHDSSYGVLTASEVAQFIDDFEDDAAFTFVACGNAGIGNEL
jgi:hypothetical protein